MNKEEFNKLYETLKKSKFRQQKFPGWRPLPTISCITIIFISAGVFFIIFGIFILIFTGQVKEFKFRYDLYCAEKKRLNEKCDFPLSIPETMKKPIMIYYQINDLRQNHRFYMENKSDKQLKGEEVSKEDLEKSNDCEGALYNKDFSLNAQRYPEDEVAFPCGLIAKSFFRDNFTLWQMSGKEINVTTEEITYKKDRDDLSNVGMKDNQWLDVTDEHFIIWKRIAPFESPRKLWGKIEGDDINSGSTVTVTIDDNNYFNFEKYIILSTRNVFGGKSSFLGILYIVFGAVCLISAVIFINVYNYFHKKAKT
jgi:uncharacterized membrane protein